MRKATIGRNAIRGLFVLTAIGVVCWSVVERLEYGNGPRPISRQATGYPQLISYGELPNSGDLCLPGSAPVYTEASAGPDDNLFSSFEATPTHAAAQEAGTTTDITRPPVRTVWDTDPI